MAEELKPDQGASQDQGTTPQAGTDQSTPQSNEELEKLKKALEDQKKEIAGLNRKISEDEKALRQKELDNLKGIERERAELELLKAEKEQIAKEAEALRRSRIIDKCLFDTGIPQEFAKRISGDTEEEIQADVKMFNDFVEGLVKQRVEKTVNEKLGGKAPVSGTVPVSNDLQTQYAKAKQEGNFALQNAIKRQAAKEGLVLNE